MKQDTENKAAEAVRSSDWLADAEFNALCRKLNAVHSVLTALMIRSDGPLTEKETDAIDMAEERLNDCENWLWQRLPAALDADRSLDFYELHHPYTAKYEEGGKIVWGISSFAQTSPLRGSVRVTGGSIREALRSARKSANKGMGDKIGG